MADDPAIKSEIEDATDDLRDALHQINDRVEEGVAKLRPDRGIRRHPITSACLAGALGFALGSDSAEVAMIGLVILGGVIVLSNEHKNKSDETERV
ncbi:hypothetical protein [Candidatus Binatus sp.]|uniref:hypothetical protein n=1 Tax=Candidatus Binatus sp. TaxID=2811406 RepID=UPI003BB0840B